MNLFKQLRALLLPVTVAGVVPGLILLSSRVTPSWLLPHPWNWLTPALSLLLAGCGLILLVGTISAFARIGGGTLAPWDPPQKLVVRGVYRRVRNPMISGVFAILLGEALLFGSLPLFFWFLFAVLVNLLYIPLSEEPGLERRFGEGYLQYKKNVPRWIPRLRPWEPEAAHPKEEHGQ
jgi:protein-S-isoprenylcysteine O-methyltransferase Ste14